MSNEIRLFLNKLVAVWELAPIVYFLSLCNLIVRYYARACLFVNFYLCLLSLGGSL